MSSFKRNFIISVISGLIALAIVLLGVYFHDYYREREERVTASAAAPPLTICSCTSKSPVPHRTEPTCTTSGRSYTTCGNCGGRIGDIQTLAALGHNYEWVVDREASCTAEGSRHQVCTRCNATGATETIAMLAHTSDMFKHVDEPTCTGKGYIYNLCTVCGARINVQMQNALGHSYSWVVDKAATCTEEGSRHEECSRCHLTGATETIAMVEHTSDEFKHVDEPTCTEKGYIYNLCTVCGARINEQMQNALGHSYSWVVDKAATCTEEGSRHEECSRCNATGTTEAIAVLAHTSDEFKHVDEPTCTEKGYIYNLCTVCGARINEQMQNALGHSYSWVVDKAATCTEEGSRHKECSRCHLTGATETIAMVEHTSDEFKHVEAPTCTEKGYIYNLCTVCGARINVQMQNALGHSYSWVRTTSPTCTAEGVDSYQCSHCGDVTETRSVAALGHNYEWVVDREASCTAEGSRHQVCTRCNATGATETIALAEHTSDMFKHVDEPTCTEKGYIYNLCTVCGARINVQMQNALGHSYSWVVDKAATCTEEGSRHEECSRCHVTGATETIAMVEHTSDEFKHVEAPTCTEKGYIYNLCTVCGARINVQMQNALGHSYSWVVDKAATCTEEGIKSYRCSRCHDVSATETIAIVEHTSDMFKHVDEPTCTEKGYIYNLCTVCGARINVQMQNALGHSYSWVRTTSPTCTAEGVDSYQCSRCRDVTETRSVAALGHDYEWIVDREATCANSGSRHQECTRCHATGATESVDKVAHTPTNIQLVQPTCTAPGWKVYFCMECGQECSRKENGAALGHDYEWVYDKEASCSVDGLRHQKCSRCSSETAQETYRDAHTPGLKDLVAPTCTTPGYTIYRCSVCNVEMSRDTVPALGHSCNVPDATCTVSMECTRCGLTIKPALGHDTHPCVDETCGKCGEMVAATMNHAWSDWQLVSEATATHEGEKVRTCEVCGAEERQAIPVTGGSGENTGGSGTDDGSGGDGDFNIGDSISGIEIPDGAKVAIAAVGGVLLVSVVIGVFTSVFGKKRKR